jgi:hypothetical protein
VIIKVATPAGSGPSESLPFACHAGGAGPLLRNVRRKARHGQNPTIILLGLAALGVAAQAAERQTNQVAIAFPEWENPRTATGADVNAVTLPKMIPPRQEFLPSTLPAFLHPLIRYALPMPNAGLELKE